jgi:hypothetical protein
MLRDDALEQRGRDPRVPNPIGIHDHDRPATADAETWRLAALDAIGTEEETVTLKQRRQHLVELLPAPIG